MEKDFSLWNLMIYQSMNFEKDSHNSWANCTDESTFVGAECLRKEIKRGGWDYGFVGGCGWESVVFLRRVSAFDAALSHPSSLGFALSFVLRIKELSSMREKNTGLETLEAAAGTHLDSSYLFPDFFNASFSK